MLNVHGLIVKFPFMPRYFIKINRVVLYIIILIMIDSSLNSDLRMKN